MIKTLKNLSLFPDKIDLKSWLISFLIINFCFLYHSLNFMWGNHDVKFIKEELLLTSGLFEGRFTQFIPYTLLTNGQILPVLNNLIGFFFLTLALWLLAKYWKIKKSLLNYTLFITFFATLPYTLSWLYFTFITISCLLWAFIAILGLYFSAQIYQSPNKLALSSVSILCFYVTLGGYPPIINTFLVCLAAKIVFSYVFENKTLKELLIIHKYTLLNILIAAVFFKTTLHFLPHDEVYNLETTPLSALPAKFITTLKIAFSQFYITTPFMPRGYKLLLLTLCILAFLGALIKTDGYTRKLITLVLLIGTIWTTSLTTFLVVPHTEFVSRIDFYGFAFLYAFALGLLLSFELPLAQSIALILAPILIFQNIINDYRALKSWQQGFEAEFQILDRIIERVENHPNFTPSRQYRFYQIGDISLRPAYHQTRYDKDDVFLISLPYLAMWQGENLMEFYSPFAYINHQTPLLTTDITPEVYDFFIHKAAPFPHKNAVFINNDIIVVIYDQTGLDDFRQKIKQLYPEI
ncbi:MAG: glucosyltransferase domain-containing protein [Alphaproteobacteria bacterium]|nr:glucosyltransferase domain-containing protein [Alphaproteobacteria bacterium]